jgi:GPH family glycoside/pentoside/hexuronide:cation symporter
MKVAYAYATFMALGLFYSFLYVPYSALLPMMTRNPAEKVQLGSFRAMGTSIGSMLVYATCLPLVGLIGGHNRQLGFTAAAAIMGAASLLLYIPVALNCRERFVDPPAIHSVSVARSLRQMIHNPVWRVVFVVTLLTFVRLGLLVSSLVYFAKDVLGKPWLISLLLPALSVCILAGGAIATPYLKRFGTRNGNMIVQAVSMFLLALAWLLQSHTALFITLFAASNIPGGIVGTTGFVLMADSVEMNQAKFGQRSEGLLSSSVIFTMKVGMAIGVAATAYVLGWVGYNPAHVSAAAQSAVTWLFYGGPLLLAAGAAIGISFYRGPKLG